MKKIILTGGGTAGHVTPNIALIPSLRAEGYSIVYIGGRNSIEKELIEAQGVEFYEISAGKLRRYLSAKNLSDMFKVVKGIGEARSLVKKLKPGLIFSKGGFVAVPVAIAGWLCRVPVIIHESDLTPGLANKLALRFASAVCVSFPETAKKIGKPNTTVTGSPIRGGITLGERSRGLAYCGLTGAKPVILLTGGSQGSKILNAALREALPALTNSFDVIHLCGKGNKAEINQSSYFQLEYATDELRDLFAACDLVVSRAGANTIFEILALRKPNLLIPLSKEASRGDQIENAASFEAQGFSAVLKEEALTAESLAAAVNELYAKRGGYIEKMKASTQLSGVEEVMAVIRKNVKM